MCSIPEIFIDQKLVHVVITHTIHLPDAESPKARRSAVVMVAYASRWQGKANKTAGKNPRQWSRTL